MPKHLCIHGHFYQPPREDPWLNHILPEGSAAPGRHWNERICRESYAPMAWARLLDHNGRIRELVNCYEWISFNVGPTLLHWLEFADPATYARMLEGDAASLKRWGHGNALAQIYHHVIMPLASPRDKEVEVAWALADFRARFRRDPEGIWLSETAVDLATLEVLADHDLRFTLLAPRQAEAVAGEDGAWRQVEEAGLDVHVPYLVDLPSGRQMAVFFYDGSLSQAVAFERLLEDGEGFWKRLAGRLHPGGLLSLATDGETYGHHFEYGEMGLAYVLSQARSGRDGAVLTNFGAVLEASPPVRKVRLREPSSWSCVHGVERWRADCGCTTGGTPGWNQLWRAPLRQALDQLKQGIDDHFLTLGRQCFADPQATLLAYGEVLAGSMEPSAFEAQQMMPGLDGPAQRMAWGLLAMQQWALASLASCAWFFDELSRLEPLNAMTFARRAVELCRRTGGPDLEPELERMLSRAQANLPGKGSGRRLYRDEVKPRAATNATMIALALLKLRMEGRLQTLVNARVDWPGVSVLVEVEEQGPTALAGRGEVRWRPGTAGEQVRWKWLDISESDPWTGKFLVRGGGKEQRVVSADLAWNKRQSVALSGLERLEEITWQEGVLSMENCLSLYLPWQESQSAPNLEDAWARFGPQLSFLYVRDGSVDWDEEQRRDLSRFLRGLALHGAWAGLAGRRIAESVLSLLGGDEPDCQTAAGMIARAKDVEMVVHWWPVQNRVWRLLSAGGEVPGLEALAWLLGFSDDAGKGRK